MRFLFGILIGAALTLLVATTTNAPTHPVLSGIASGWRTFIQATGELVFRQRSEQTPASAELPKKLTQKSVSGSSRQKSDGTDAAERPDPVAAPSITPMLTTTPAAEPTPAATPATPALPEATAESAPATVRAAETPPDRTPFEPLSGGETPSATITQFGGGETAAADSISTATVWTPFHSERSAEGFANRLSQQVAHSFTVQRQGPGAYQVIFAYASIDERDALLQEIAEVTGQ